MNANLNNSSILPFGESEFELDNNNGDDEERKYVHHHFPGIDITNVSYISRRRSTHSDVMSTITTVIKPLDQGSSSTPASKKKRNSIAFSMPISKLNRELLMERKAFFENLHRERYFRAQVENGAATMIQSVVRRHLCQKALNSKRREESHDNEIDERVEQDATQKLITRKGAKPPGMMFAGSMKTSKDQRLLKKQLRMLNRRTDKVAGPSTASTSKRKTAPVLSKKKHQRFAIRLQCLVRRFLAKRFVQVVKLYAEEEKQRQAVVTIQSNFRNMKYRMNKQCKEHDEMRKAAVLVQSHVRKYLDIEFVKVLKVHLRRAVTENRAAIRMQRLLRKVIAKNKLVQARLERASTIVQAGVRGYSTRTVIKKQHEERSNGATMLQKQVRGHLSRMSFKKRQSQVVLGQKIDLATKLQAVQRGNSTRKLLLKKKQDDAATVLQAKQRQCNAKTKVKQKRKEHSAATKIQTNERKHMAIKKVNLMRDQNKAAVQIQKQIRRRQAKTIVEKN